MERISLLIDQTLGLLFDVSPGARGLYVTCNLMAGQHCGDEIESGKVIFMGREPTPEMLSGLMHCEIEEVKGWVKELVKHELITTGPLVIKQFKKDNEPFIKMRQGGRLGGKQGVLRGLEGGFEGAVIPQDKIRKDKIRKDKTRVEDQAELIGANPPSDNPEDVFRFYYHQLKGYEYSWMAKLTKKYGRSKFNEAVEYCKKKGWATGRIEEYLKAGGDPFKKKSDVSRNKVGKGKGKVL